MSKRLIVGIPLLMIVTLGAVSFFILQDGGGRDVLSENVFRDDSSGISFTYPDLELQQDQFQDDTEDNVTTIARLGTVEQGESPFLITVRQESRFRIVSNTIGKPALSIVRENLLANYPDRYPEFELISSDEIKIDGLSALDIVFSYTNNQQTLQQQFIAIQKNDDEMIYLIFQSSTDDYEELREKKFKPITDTIEI